ncbi:phosphoribosylglycinamide formyltransferase [Kaistella carnis]|uniref:phosphoribosylglycinamide formyltransferase n=1 Tax=Kaistella carnis TaxID=1241979 RepID=UPI00289A74BC|nr:phosphoribosylglycinamide formyltransferase [Kaistella carnis]
MKNIVVLVSGGGTNLQRIIDCIESGEIPNAQISLVVADRECFGLQRAKNSNIPCKLIPRGKTFSSELQKLLPENTDLIILAGFLSILNKEFCETFSGKIINIHPSLLPKFGGKGMWGHHVHEAVLEAGEKKSGATVHYVTSGIDEGAIILQKSFDISLDETLITLAAKIHEIEFEILPKAVNLVLNNDEKL